MTDIIEQCARELADAMGDDFDSAHESKSEWVDTRGEKGGRFRDVNEPRQPDYVDGARAVLAKFKELTALRAAQQWRGIESAPRDGTEILGYREDGGIMLIRWTYPAEFLTETECTALNIDPLSAEHESWFFADFTAGDRIEGDCIPTHWMPLPPEPQPLPPGDGQ